MTQHDKLIEKMRKRPVEADFDDVEKLLKWDGWKKARQSGSHATFVKPGHPTIFTVSSHGGKVKRTYIVKLCELLGWMSKMSTKTRPPLEEYLARAYPYQVVADPEGGYVILFPDLPGCMTQVETPDEVGPMADEIRMLWIETAYEMGNDIPPPSQPEEYSGKFNVRLPKSLHRTLAEAAERDDVSLNTYVCTLLARNDGFHRIEQRFDAMEARLDAMEEHLRYSVTGIPAGPPKEQRFHLVEPLAA